MNDQSFEPSIAIFCPADSPERHREHTARCRSFAAALPHQGPVIDIDRHTALAPADDAGAGGMANLPGLAATGTFDVLVVHDLEAVSADPVALIQVIVQLDDLGIVVVGVADRFCSDASRHAEFFTGDDGQTESGASA